MESYFLGIKLPPELDQEIENRRRRFKAPKTAPHITLIPPFEWTGQEGELLEIIRKIAAQHLAFSVRGAGLGNFGTTVLFVNVQLSAELKTLQDGIARTLESMGIEREKRPYHPHITLATRLRPEQFVQCRDALSGYHPYYLFSCDAVSVFKLITKGTTRSWVPLSTKAYLREAEGGE